MSALVFSLFNLATEAWMNLPPATLPSIVFPRAAFCPTVVITGGTEMQYLRTPVAGTYINFGTAVVRDANGNPLYLTSIPNVRPMSPPSLCGVFGSTVGAGVRPYLPFRAPP